MYVCANGKYSLYSHGRVVRAPRADAGVSVRVIGCRPVEGGEQSVCSAAGAVGWRWGHTLPQEARLWHAVITVSFTKHERDGGRESRHDGANNYLALCPSHIHSLLVELRAGGAALLSLGSVLWKTVLTVTVLGAIFLTFCKEFSCCNLSLKTKS